MYRFLFRHFYLPCPTARLQAQESSEANGDWASGFRIEPAFNRFFQR